MSDDWIPFGLDVEAETAYRVLVPGVPEWLQEPLIDWVVKRLSYRQTGEYVLRGKLLSAQSVLRLDLGVISSGDELVDSDPVRVKLQTLCDLDLLRLADYQLSGLYRRTPEVTSLEGLPGQACSAYTVGERMGKTGLVDRVPEGV